MRNRSRRREENLNSEKEQHGVREQNSRHGRTRRKRQRTAALQDIAERVVRNPSRQRLGVRLSSAALSSVDLRRY